MLIMGAKAPHVLGAKHPLLGDASKTITVHLIMNKEIELGDC